jgi:predicted DCC family thiol-disulfide oxidoreductase YuxK
VKRPSVVYPLTIYYDESCPLCAEEMHALKKYDARGRLSLIDCSPADFDDPEAGRAGIGRNELMRRIHARDATGLWLDGIAVFEAAYHAAGIENVALMWGHPRLRPLWNRAYPWVAGNRMWLSRLGFAKAFGFCVRLAADSAEQRSRACAGGLCDRQFD